MSIRELDNRDPDFERAVATALFGESWRHETSRRFVRQLLATVRHKEFALRVWVHGDGEGAFLCSLCALIMPGSTTLVHVPPGALSPRQQRALPSLLTSGELDEIPVALHQALLRPEDSAQSRILRSAGFRYMAELIYLQRSATAAPRAFTPTVNVQWHTFEESHRDRWIAALNATYEDTRDCPGLSELRTTEDILAGYRATGQFDPRGWLLASHNGFDAGLMITAANTEAQALEIVYMGVAPRFRGKSVGNLLLDKAVQRARTLGIGAVTLAVDSTNEPARRLYARWGFVESNRYRAWIKPMRRDDITARRQR